MIKKCLENVRNTSPLVHNITNYVTVNDCANILLAIGASPIMSDEIEDVVDITKICTGLNINIGTLNKNTIGSMFEAGKISNDLDHPVLLDPVGVGASNLRTNTAKELIEKIQFSVIRGNISEIKALINGSGKTKGVDANVSDVVTKDNLDEVVKFAKEFSLKTNSIIAITGAIDIVADSNKAYCIYNGNPMMSKITGTGCQLSALTTAFICANKDNMLEATASAIISMGVCGEIAYQRLNKLDGNSSYRNYIIDAIYNLSSDDLEKMSKYEIR